MSTLCFRPATTEDVGAVVALVESAYRGEASRAGWTTEADLLDGQRTDAAAVDAMVHAADRLVLLALDGHELRGCCELRTRADGSAYFGMFAVTPALQGAGIGGRLLSQAERHARDTWRSTRMDMTVLVQREELIAWYERRGYRRTGVTEPFPYGDERFGRPRRPDLLFEVLTKELVKPGEADAPRQ